METFSAKDVFEVSEWLGEKGIAVDYCNVFEGE
jgi:hypothetical protein